MSLPQRLLQGLRAYHLALATTPTPAPAQSKKELKARVATRTGAAPRAPRPPKQAPPKAGADAAGGAGSDAGGGSAAAPQQELSREQLAAFVRKRARDASIQRRIYRDFADAGDGGGGGDANPLLRANKRLRDSNPLRGQWDE